MSDLLLSFDISAIEPEIETPSADRLLAGSPVFTTWNLEEADGGIFAGVWQATVGKWSVSYQEWEYIRILEGVSILTQDGEAPVTLRAGDSYIIRPGFTGTWEVIETTRKEYVIRD